MVRKRVSRKRTSRKKKVSRKRTSRKKKVSRKKSKRQSRRRRVSRRQRGGANVEDEWTHHHNPLQRESRTKRIHTRREIREIDNKNRKKDLHNANKQERRRQQKEWTNSLAYKRQQEDQHAYDIAARSVIASHARYDP